MFVSTPPLPYSEGTIFNISLSNLFPYSLFKVHSVNSVPNKVLASVELTTLVPSLGNYRVKLQERLCFTIGKANKKYQKHVITLDV